ncbi:hypothetical protein C9422_18695 [Pseudomonas sp. B1(2018)]|nr:hypothetical protein C9422_18695 [Pseudomonas sp. B1(2018)]
MSPTEEAVLAQARLRAMSRGESEAMAVIHAQSAVDALKESLKGDEYQEALERLLEEYSKS